MRNALAVIAVAMAMLGLPRTGMAQLDADVRMGTPRTPGLLIEEPRPPNVAIETEGRGQRPDCRPVTITERHNGIPVTRIEQQCDR
jgi:hypothetical protein